MCLEHHPLVGPPTRLCMFVALRASWPNLQEQLIISDSAKQTFLSMQVREQGNSRLGTKVEVKNMNSFSAMQRAIDFEIDRQVRFMADYSNFWPLEVHHPVNAIQHRPLYVVSAYSAAHCCR